MNDVLVSVVVPIYNGEKYIQRCVSCLQAQTYSNYEVIFINDGSKDNSGKILDEIAKKDSRIRVIHKENSGVCAARNDGIMLSSGAYVYFYDVDDEITPNLLEENVTLAIKNNADVVMFGFWYKLIEQNKEIINEPKHLFVGDGEDFFRQELIAVLKSEILNAPWNKLFRVNFLRDSGLLFDERYPIYEDIMFNVSLLKVAKNIVISPNAYYKYCVMTSGTAITRFFEVYFEAVTQFYYYSMDYCKQFENHMLQEEEFTKVYITYVYTHLKQISTQENLSRHRKKELIESICDSTVFIEALEKVTFTGKKRYICHLIKKKRVNQIIALYYGISWLQEHNLVGGK